jgi:hypothetical protein
VADNKEFQTKKAAPTADGAVRAASQEMLAKLHGNGELRERFPSPLSGEKKNAPSPDDYPQAPPRFFQKPEEIVGWCWLFPQAQSCQVRKTVQKAGGLYICSFKIKISKRKYETTRHASFRDDAIVAATRAMLAKLHHNGVLKKRLSKWEPLEFPVDPNKIAKWHEHHPEAPVELFQTPELMLGWGKMFPRQKHVQETKRIGYERWKCVLGISVFDGTIYEIEKLSTTQGNAVLVASQ